jgi:hypothetical protein
VAAFVFALLERENAAMDEPQWWEFEIDLSALTYAEFLAFFFDRPVVGQENEYDLFRTEMHRYGASDPIAVVGHLQAMCQNFAELTKVYSHEQLDQGLWAVFGPGITCERYLFDPTVDIRLRMDCIESMYLPFRDVAASLADIPSESFYFMWWHMIPFTFWATAEFDYAEFNYSDLNDDRKQMADTMYQTLSKILALDHRGCQRCALHGLGHLHHPLVRETVQSYLNVHRNELTDEDVKWVEQCRDGSNM